MFKVQPFEQKPLSWWHTQAGSIDLNPVFQRRGKLWTPKDKALFIDSILNGFDVPKFYVADFRFSNALPNPSKKPYAMVDGKQRFETIFEFFDGKFSLDGEFVLFENPKLELAGLGYKDLFNKFPNIAQKFSGYMPNVMSIITDEEGKINELFIRLNRSKPLVGAEVRNAMKGRVPPTVRLLVKHSFFSSCIRFAKERYQDRNAATKLLLIEFHGRLVDTKKKQLDSLVLLEQEQRSEEGFGRAVKLVKKNLKIMSQVFKANDKLLSSQGPVTLYYWFIRKYGAKYKKVIREFLVKLEKDRKDNQIRADQRLPGVDDELLNFSRLKRSPNDQGSLASAFGIMEKRFELFLRQKKLISD
jgi:hypothetical protein